MMRKPLKNGSAPSGPVDPNELPKGKWRSQIAWNRRHKREREAQRAVARAIRRGELQRQPCAECGEPHVHGHHDDYDEPLAVTWLCPLHHRRLHAQRNREWQE